MSDMFCNIYPIPGFMGTAGAGKMSNAGLRHIEPYLQPRPNSVKLQNDETNSAGCVFFWLTELHPEDPDKR